MAQEKDDVPVDQLKELAVAGDDEDTPGYKAPAKVDLETLKNMDADDESLVKYKQDLLKGSEGNKFVVLNCFFIYFYI